MRIQFKKRNRQLRVLDQVLAANTSKRHIPPPEQSAPSHAAGRQRAIDVQHPKLAASIPDTNLSKETCACLSPDAAPHPGEMGHLRGTLCITQMGDY